MLKPAKILKCLNCTNFQKLEIFRKFKICKNRQISKIGKNFKNLWIAKIAEIAKISQNCKNRQKNFPNFTNFLKLPKLLAVTDMKGISVLFNMLFAAKISENLGKNLRSLVCVIRIRSTLKNLSCALLCYASVLLPIHLLVWHLRRRCKHETRFLHLVIRIFFLWHQYEIQNFSTPICNFFWR